MAAMRWIRGETGAALARLTGWAAAAAGLALISNPGLIPPGNVVTVGHYVAFGGLILGAYCESLRVHPRWLLYYGLVGGMGFAPTCLPDRRDMIAIGYGQASLGQFYVAACAIVVISGLACAATGLACQIVDVRRRRPARGRCRKCGYLLYSLPEPRCPECGTPFERTDAKPPASPPTD